jgi:hypothetical protein
MRIITRGAVIGSALMSIALFGTGIASADDYAGKTYSEASQALSNAGKTGVISTVVGGKLPTDDCLVTSSHPASFVRDEDGDFTHASGEVMLALNCNAAFASAKSPGNSVASPEGRAAKEHDESMTWRRQNPEWCVQMEKDHPEWAPLEGCHDN